MLDKIAIFTDNSRGLMFSLISKRRISLLHSKTIAIPVMFRVIVLIVWFAAAFLVNAQTKNENRAVTHVDFETFDRLLSELKKRVGQNSDKSLSIIAEIQRNLTSLQVEQRKLGHEKIYLTEEYVASLDRDAEILQNLMKGNTSEETLRTKLSYLNEDIRIKLSHLTKSPAYPLTYVYIKQIVYYYNGGKGPGYVYGTATMTVKGRINVAVITRRGNEEVKGYEVWYVEKGLADYPTYYKRFDRLTSPTEKKTLAPGAYFVWIMKDKEQKSGRQPMDVGPHGIEQDYEISVPN